MHHNKSKHIDIHHHYIRELASTWKVMFKYYETDEMSAMFLTKEIYRTKHYECMEKLGLRQLGI